MENLRDVLQIHVGAQNRIDGVQIGWTWTCIVRARRVEDRRLKEN